ncbi:hypothetical protein ACHAXN_002564 [Cyclotella atomus]
MMMCTLHVHGQLRRHCLTKGTLLLASTPSNALLFSPYKNSSMSRFFTSSRPSIPSSAARGKTSIVASSLLLLGCALSDPFLDVIEDSKRDANVSYWKMRSEESQDEITRVEHSTSQQIGCRLRNAPSDHNTATTDSKSFNSPPEYARVVIVGGGMAGLHTALCLAERMHNSGSRGVNHPQKRSWNIFWRQGQPETKLLQSVSKAEIVVLEADTIGNGASGRAKGLVVPGFQVPLENLEMNAIDYHPPTDSPSLYTIPSILRTIQSALGIQNDTPRYSKAIVKELHDATYVALDRLRDIVKRYEIDCDWVESGVVEASIHDMEEEEESGNGELEEDDDGCRVLTSSQVDQMMGRQVTAAGDNSNNLYKWGEYDPNCAGVDPYALTRGLADAVEGWGVKIYEHANVAKLEKNTTMPANQQQQSTANQGKYELTTKEGHTIQCDHVVLCTGAATGLSKRLSNSILPIYTWMVATEPLYDKCPLRKEAAEAALSDDAHPKVSLGAAPMGGDDHFALNYWRNDNREEGRLLFGSLCDTYSLPSLIISWRLRNALSEVYPHLSNVKFDHVWGGKLAVALNAMPIIGRDVDYDNEDDSNNEDLDVTEDGVWYSTGFSGHGIVPTTLAGSVIANAILGISDRVGTADTQVMTQERQLWQLFHTYFPPTSWNGYPFSRVGAGAAFLVYNLFDWLGKKGVPVPRLPEIW